MNTKLFKVVLTLSVLSAATMSCAQVVAPPKMGQDSTKVAPPKPPVPEPEVTAEEFNSRFTAKIKGYIQSGTLDLTIVKAVAHKPLPVKTDEEKKKEAEKKKKEEENKKVVLDKDGNPVPEKAKEPPKPEDPTMVLVLSGCEMRDPAPEKVAAWEDRRDRADQEAEAARKNGLEPAAFNEEAPQPTEACTQIGKVRSLLSEIMQKSVSTTIQKVLYSSKAIDLDKEGTYIKVQAYESKLLVFRKNIGSEQVETYYPLKEVLFTENTKKFDLKIGYYNVTLALKLTYTGSKQYLPSDLLTKPIPHPLLLIDVLSKTPELEHLFAKDSGVWENYTIKEHSLRVIELLNQQYSCQIKPEFEERVSKILKMPLKNFMQITMAFHDIGKPLAVEAGDKDRQHEFTRPVMDRNLKALQVPKEAASVSLELTDNDAIGDYLTSRVRLDEATHVLEAQAKKTVLSKEDYFVLQKLFYTADAGSYPGLHEGVFKETRKTGCVELRAPKYKKLEERFIVPPKVEEAKKEEVKVEVKPEVKVTKPKKP